MLSLMIIVLLVVAVGYIYSTYKTPYVSDNVASVQTEQTASVPLDSKQGLNLLAQIKSEKNVNCIPCHNKCVKQCHLKLNETSDPHTIESVQVCVKQCLASECPDCLPLVDLVK